MDNQDLVAKITEDGLNQVVTAKGYEGSSTLYWLSGAPNGRAILEKCPRLVMCAQTRILNSLKKEAQNFIQYIKDNVRNIDNPGANYRSSSEFRLLQSCSIK